MALVHVGLIAIGTTTLTLVYMVVFGLTLRGAFGAAVIISVWFRSVTGVRTLLRRRGERNRNQRMTSPGNSQVQP